MIFKNDLDVQGRSLAMSGIYYTKNVGLLNHSVIAVTFMLGIIIWILYHL